MSARSWTLLERREASLDLSPSLRGADARGGVDIGWAEQMTPFVLELTSPGDRVLDPFAGLGTTLLAAALEGRRALGVEIDGARARLARARLDEHGIGPEQAEIVEGDARVVPLGSNVFSLALTNVPYFGCEPGRPLAPPGQLYAAPSYLAYLELLDDVIERVERALVPGGVMVAMAENVRVSGETVPLAWDVGRLLGRRMRLRDERILLYHRPREGEGRLGTDRSHEYALVAEKRRPELDPREALSLLSALDRAGARLAAVGSFAALLRGERLERPPADLDLVVDRPGLDRVAAELVRRGFELRVWGERVALPLDRAACAGKHYLRAMGPLGARLVVDVSYEPEADIARALEGRVERGGVWVLPGPVWFS